MRNLCFAFVVLVATSLSADTPSDTFQELFGEQLKKVSRTRSGDDDLALARELLVKASGLKDEASLPLFYDYAFQLAGKSRDGNDVAIEAMRALEKRVPGKAIEARAKIIEIYEALYRRARGEGKEEIGEKLIEVLDVQGQSQLAAGDPTAAAMTYQGASNAARVIKSPHAPMMQARLEQARERVQAHKRIEILKRRVLNNTSNQDAATELVELMIVKLNQPDQTADYAPLVDKTLRTRIELAVKPIDDLAAVETAAMGHWYQELAQGQRGLTRLVMLERAQTYLTHHMDNVLERKIVTIKAEVALKNVKAAIQKIHDDLAPKERGGWKDPTKALIAGMPYAKKNWKGEYAYSKGVFSIKTKEGYASIWAFQKPAYMIFSVEVRRVDGNVKFSFRSGRKGSTYFVSWTGENTLLLCKHTHESGTSELASWNVPELKDPFMELRLAVLENTQIVFHGDREIMRANDKELGVPDRIAITARYGHGQFRKPRVRVLSKSDMQKLLAMKKKAE